MAVAAHKLSRSRLTFRDLWQTPDDGNRWEIVHGEVHVSPPPDVAHQTTALNLASLLRAHARNLDLGDVWVAPIGVVLGKAIGVQPDIVYVAKERLDIVQEKAIFGAPDLVIEILSPSTATRDRGIKKEAYEQSGVAHYWMIDPKRHTLLALHLQSEGYVIEAEVNGAAQFRPQLFPTLTIRLSEIWARKLNR